MDRIQGSTIEDLVRFKLEDGSYSQIRAELTQSGLSKDEVNEAMKENGFKGVKEIVGLAHGG